MPTEDRSLLLHAAGLTKRYGRHRALNDIHLAIPPGRIVGLVGPNGAGKSTLLHLACGLSTPTSGTLRILGARPAADAVHLARVGFVAQDTPTYATLTVAEHLRLGAKLNPSWDHHLAQRRITQVGLRPRQKAGRLSGGQRAQLALTIAAAKRPELLIFDEPAAALDPLARDEFLASLTAFVAELGASGILSSHLLSDVERICDYLVVLCAGRIQLAGAVDELLSNHHRLVLPPGEIDRLPHGIELIRLEHVHGRATALVRADADASLGRYPVEPVTLEELALSYLGRATTSESHGVDGTGGDAI
ncbi:ABC transporter ATP-binding protein [Phytoactinopolyspora limicola]|uniref:ABC transporter ATP-binding protein n=1 Tax=Phytoactinopolyspora limicola TaxID=2715536 RepID=UPI00140817FB|nr:ABC transporter ATP-binding protein [Phytoactinopolyspora limicola]